MVGVRFGDLDLVMINLISGNWGTGRIKKRKLQDSLSPLTLSIVAREDYVAR